MKSLLYHHSSSPLPPIQPCLQLPLLFKHAKLVSVHIQIQTQIQATMRLVLTQEATGSFGHSGDGDGQSDDHVSDLNDQNSASGLFEDPNNSTDTSLSGAPETMSPFESIMDTLPVNVRNMVTRIVEGTDDSECFAVNVAMMARLEHLFMIHTEVQAENSNASWAPDYSRNLCAQFFIDPTLEAFTTLLTDGPNGQNNCLERRVLSDLLSKNAEGIRDVLPKNYAGEDGSKGGAAVSVALKEIERNGRSTFRKQIYISWIPNKLLHNVLPIKAVAPSVPPFNLKDFCGYLIHKTYPSKKHISADALFNNLKPGHVIRIAFLRLASVCIYAHPGQDRKICQWQTIDQKLDDIKEQHSAEFAEAFGRLVLIKDHKIFDGVRLYTKIQKSYSDDLVLPNDAEVRVEVASPSEVPQFHQSLA
ncbi:uncharacterized protein MELLADRAFT_87352 [Melampsora larici-populina 98AG31]|uniref:Uncharacterized protein n=1 Tax=Melampsora larici-populina (strain 98AG31 / pathotype 3-4-7) TaxID=747676 RepID=F4RMZ2_MELLP|nr:uncharacterized protein MELLADRAFT_87352 [Melampsora larici-populina 98AG31]EGG06203.1 hypothetical protein MELLADRAFT_87352 [Melampsora larici-populina 98AG31]